MSRITYVIFLAVSSAKEIGQIFSLKSNPILDLLYIIMFMYMILKMMSNTLPPWVWRDGFGIVGLSAILYLILIAIGVPSHPIKIIDSSICLFAWIKSMNYLNNYKEENENI